MLCVTQSLHVELQFSNSNDEFFDMLLQIRVTCCNIDIFIISFPTFYLLNCPIKQLSRNLYKWVQDVLIFKKNVQMYHMCFHRFYCYEWVMGQSTCCHLTKNSCCVSISLKYNTTFAAISSYVCLWRRSFYYEYTTTLCFLLSI